MNTLKLNVIHANYLFLPKIEESGDVPSGYDVFITADGKVFNALDGAFYVKL